MANTIGTAYINIAPNMQGIQGKISQGLQGTGSAVSADFEKETSGIGKVFNGVMAGVNAAASVTALAIGTVIATSLGDAISRVDTLNNATRTFQNMGFSIDQVNQVTKDLKQSILGLPTALNSAVTNVQLLASATGDLDKSRKIFSALNDGILGFGGSTEMVSNATLQLGQALANGRIDAQTWNSLLNSQFGPALVAIGKQMGITTGQLKQGLSEGSISVGSFEDALISLDQNGGGGLVSLQQIALQSTAGIGTSMENLHTAIVRGMAGIIQAIGAPQIAGVITNLGKLIEGLEGKISAFITAFKAGGGTLAGALAPVLPVVGLLAGSLGPLLSQIPVLGSLFGGLTGPVGIVIGLIGGIVAASPQLQAAFGQVFGVVASTFQTLMPVFSQVLKIVVNLMQQIGNALAPVVIMLAEAFGNVVLALAPLIPPLLQLASNIIQNILLPVLPMVAQFILLLSQVFMELVKALMPILPPLEIFVQQIINALVPVMPQLIAALTQLLMAFLPLIPVLAQLVIALLPALTTLLTITAKILTGVIGVAAVAVTKLIYYFADAVTWVVGHLKLLGEIIGVIIAVAFLPLTIAIAAVVLIVKNWGNITSAVGNAVKSVFNAVGNVVSSVFGAIAVVWNSVLYPVFSTMITIITTVGMVFERIFAFILLVIVGTIAIIVNAILQPLIAMASFIYSSVLQPIFNFFVNTFNSIVSFISGIINTIIGVVVAGFNLVNTYIVQPIAAAVGYIMAIFGQVLGFIGGVVGTIASVIGSAFATAYNAVAGWVGGIWNSVTGVFNNVVNFLGGIAGRVIGVLSGAGSWLVNAGKDVIQGFLNGASSLISTIGNFFLNHLPGWIRGPFKDALGIHSPSTVFAGFGKNTMQGYVNGVAGSQNMVQGTMSDMADAAMQGFGSPTALIASSVAPGSTLNPVGIAANNANGAKNTFTGNIYLNTAEAVKEMFTQLNQGTINVGMGLTPTVGN